jgi:leucyl-tRNA synthetase
MEKLQLNTCITALIKFLYALEDLENEPCEDGTIIAEHSAFRDAWCTLLVLLSPVTPHLCEELWERMPGAGRLGEESWPVYDPRLEDAATVQIIVKVDAKPVTRLEVPSGASRHDVIALAYRDRAVTDRIGGRRIAREIYVPGQILNFVTS